MRVLAFDPGHTTGWACFDKGQHINHNLVDRGTIKDWHGVDKLIETCKPDVIVYEIFRLYAHKASFKTWDSFLEVEVIGVIRYLAELNNIPILGQTPNDGKHFFDEKRLKALSLWDGTTHVRDATGHALYFLTFNTGKVEKV